MEKKTIVLLYGGRSGEHEVSLRSAAFVYENIDRSLYRVLPVGISPEGIWYLQPENIEAGKDGLPIYQSESDITGVLPGRGLLCHNAPLHADLVFPILHGSFGEDGTLQGLLEMADLPYAGAGVTGCSLSMDKELVKRVWENAGLPVVPFASLSKDIYYRCKSESHPLPEDFQKRTDSFGLPLFVKPANTGSSLGVNRVESPEDLGAALEEAFLYDEKLLVEPCLTAREIECSVIGNHFPRAFPPGEVISSHTFYDYKAKYTDPDGAQLLIPAPIPEETKEKVMSTALAAYKAAELSGMSRVDFFLNDNGEVFLNELNAIPGFTSISMYPMMCSHGGLGNRELVQELITLGFERYEERNKIRFTL